MITAISKVKETNSKANYTNQSKNNPIQKQYYSSNSSAIKEENQVSFKGNLGKVGQNFLVEEGSRFGKKITKIAEEALESLRISIRKLTHSNEIPYTQKPLILLEDQKKVAIEIKTINDARGVNAPHSVMHLLCTEYFQSS
jgi:hypothetical protein